jgi:hypothetical protein
LLIGACVSILNTVVGDDFLFHNAKVKVISRFARHTRHARHARYAGSMAALLLAGCRESAVPRAAGVTTRDSAGIEIVDNTSAVWQSGAGWKMSDRPILSIGTDVGGPEYEFGFAHGPVRLSDGRIVVADMQTQLMRFYDGQGKFLMSAGGSGMGPGEFEQLYRLRKMGGDSLMALNPASLTSIFSPDGKYVRRFDLDPVRLRGNMWWLGRLSDGTLLAMSLQREGTRELAPSPNPRPGVEEARFDIPQRDPLYRDTLLHFLYTMEGRLIDSIVKLPGQWLGRVRALVPNAAYAFFENTFFHSPGDVVEIRQYRSLVGERAATTTVEHGTPLVKLERIIRRVPLRDAAITDEDRNQYLQAERARYAELARRNPGRVDLARLERMVAETEFPPTVPAHGNRMYADALGHLWLQEYRIGPNEPYRWSIFDRAGRWLGIVQTPTDFTVNEIGADYVLGVSQDSLGVQYVRMYRLEKR